MYICEFEATQWHICWFEEKAMGETQEKRSDMV